MTAGAMGADFEEILRAALDVAFERGRCSDVDKGAAIDAIVQTVRDLFDARDRPAPDSTAPVGSEELTGAVDEEGLAGVLAEQEADEVLLSEPVLHTMNGLVYLIGAATEFEKSGSYSSLEKVKKIYQEICSDKNLGRPSKYSLEDLAKLANHLRSEFYRQEHELKMEKVSKRKAAHDLAAKGVWKNGNGEPRTGEDLRCNWLGKAFEAEHLIFKRDMMMRRIRFHWGPLG